MNITSMGFKMAGFLFLASTSLSVHAMQEKTRAPGKAGEQGRRPHARKENFVTNALIGSAAGAGEALFNQPAISAKNALQQKRPLGEFIKSPALLYSGLGVNLLSVVPSTAAQMGISHALKEVMPSDDTVTGMPIALARNGLAGVGAALLCNPSELVIINQQNWKTGAWPTMQRLYRENGMSVAMRGYTAKAGRESIFCAGFLAAYPLIKEKLKSNYGLDGLAGTVAATTVVGPVIGVATHPFDTISTRMQADPSEKQFKGFWDTARKIWAQGGLRGYGAGLLPRIVRIKIAIPLMSEISNRLKKVSYAE